mmetsp:Transcript_4255/g.6526  ORF Transcript_4255/g.6526 Transcript_4255/m.6526 type:complete len:158 (-) Transcript_4255:251-724(-)
MGSSPSSSPGAPHREPPVDKIRVCVAGFTASHNVGRAVKVANAVADADPAAYTTWFYFVPGRFSKPENYKNWLAEFIASQKDNPTHAAVAKHTSAPFCWLEKPDGSIVLIGGRDSLCEWASKTFADSKSVTSLCVPGEPPYRETNFAKEAAKGANRV